ncbi:MAG: hypothetical protein K2H95_05330 [Bacteroidales bacterium]|nr:hypothetical protein [Bacteroidales bacterium]MDE5956363.1 hypothetical protein [Bacteroidales bacterium]
MKTTVNKDKSPDMAQKYTAEQLTSRKSGHVVTQLTPDDLMTDDCLRKSVTGADGEPSAQQLNQEITAINPSVESMDGRG